MKQEQKDFVTCIVLTISFLVLTLVPIFSISIALAIKSEQTWVDGFWRAAEIVAAAAVSILIAISFVAAASGSKPR